MVFKINCIMPLQVELPPWKYALDGKILRMEK
jgi:hypothetical protein